MTTDKEPEATRLKTRVSRTHKLDSRAFQSRQIDIFQTFLCNTDDERDHLSNTIELWDSLPKYSISKLEMTKRRTPDGFLKLLTVNFRYKGQSLSIVIQPAKILDEDGVERDYYPSASEELIEDALRKIASERQHGFFEENIFESGVVFTIYQLREELAKRGHTRSHAEIVKSLNILAGSMIEIRTEGIFPGEGFTRANYLTGLAATSRKKLKDDPSAKWVAQFHPLVTHSIHSATYRQYDYHAMMKHSTQLARWLRKQISTKFNFASMTTSFEILWSTVHRDSNLLNYSRLRDGIAALDEAFEELKMHSAIFQYEKSVIKGPHNKTLDVRYTLHPSLAFVREMKAANKRAKLSAESTQLIASDSKK
jgi:hypothetical protein